VNLEELVGLSIHIVRPAALLVILWLSAGCHSVRQLIVKTANPEAFKPQGDPTEMKASYDGPDEKRARVLISLLPVARGFNQPVDVQFVPGSDTLAVVLGKLGQAQWVSLETHRQGNLFFVDVLKDSEQGLLGLAFHPKFLENGKFYTNSTVRSKDKDVSRVQEWQVDHTPTELSHARPGRIIIEVRQPYASHNGGQLFFGADGFLYMGLGDGGWDGDPDNNAQNTLTLLGSMLRLDVDHPSNGKEYGIPSDNPFVNDKRFLPEIWAWGFRNPWRSSPTPDGKIILGDVGQNTWEEISLVEKGKNYGWDKREGRHCFEPAKDCPTDGLVDPIFEYKHGDDGRCVIGGYVYTGNRVPALHGKYIFGDFVTGRIWAIDLPPTVVNGAPLAKASALGKWPILPSAFGRNHSGDVFVVDFASGTVFAIAPGPLVSSNPAPVAQVH
jgi:glucose/arabinose dehydrogenase